MTTTVLGIESSCDETAAAVCKDGKIMNNIIATQAIHESYGGVVPELASRAHQRNIIPVVNAALKDSGLKLQDLNAIAYTQGPGLLGALLVGSSFARSLALALDIPVIPINHMKAHILAHFIDDPKPAFPFLCLTVSGGHTQIVKVKSHFEMTIIGQSIDDAVGEAFDKCAKLLGLSYPGGPLIDHYAKEGDPYRFKFPETAVPGLNYSFSGIKTAFMYTLRKEMANNDQFIHQNLNDLAASLQRTLIDMLMQKLKKAVKMENIRTIAIAGGVSANQGLRQRLEKEAETSDWKVHIPKLEYCTDNAAMIAVSGYLSLQAGKVGKLSDSPMPRMAFED